VMKLIPFLCHMPPNAMPVSCNGKPAKLLFQPALLHASHQKEPCPPLHQHVPVAGGLLRRTLLWKHDNNDNFYNTIRGGGNGPPRRTYNVLKILLAASCLCHATGPHPSWPGPGGIGQSDGS
jgi:hypothetical protein